MAQTVYHGVLLHLVVEENWNWAEDRHGRKVDSVPALLGHWHTYGDLHFPHSLLITSCHPLACSFTNLRHSLIPQYDFTFSLYCS